MSHFNCAQLNTDNEFSDFFGRACGASLFVFGCSVEVLVVLLVVVVVVVVVVAVVVVVLFMMVVLGDIRGSCSVWVR